MGDEVGAGKLGDCWMFGKPNYSGSWMWFRWKKSSVCGLQPIL